LVAELLSQNSDQEEYPLISLTNRLSLFAGLLGGVGMFIVANFQETAVIQIHLTGIKKLIFKLLNQFLFKINLPTDFKVLDILG